jgi:Ca2+-binding EF-hand superfamily protein
VRKSPKKSASIEIRLPHSVKEAFKAQCDALNLTVSERLRTFIDEALTARSAPSPTKEPSMQKPNLLFRPAFAAAAVGAVIGVALLATPSMARPDLRETFNRLDGDRDGALTLNEFRSAADASDVVFISAPGDQIPSESGGFTAPVSNRATAPQAAPISPDQLAALQGREFGRMDLDANTAVSYAEFEASHLALMRASFVSLDRNGDGMLSEGELGESLPDGAAPQIIADLDRNGDLSVDWSEFQSPL